MHTCIHKKLINFTLTHHMDETNVIHASVLPFVGVYELYIDFMQSY